MIRVGKRPADHFTTLPNTWARDPNLDWDETGVLAYILSHAEGYGLTVQQIVDAKPSGYRAVNAILKRLEAVGYLHRTRQRDPVTGRLGSYDWQLIDYDQTPQPRSSQCAETHTGPDQGKQGVSAGQTQSAAPHTGPDQGKQGVSAGQTQSAAPHTGPDQGGHPVSAGRAQCAVAQTPIEEQVLEKQLEDQEEQKHAGPAGEPASSGASDSDALPFDVQAEPPRPGRKPAKKRNGSYSPDFERFWAAWPSTRRVEKPAACAEWEKALKAGAAPETIIDGAQRYTDHVTQARTDPKFIPHPQRWIKNHRWDEELCAPVSSVPDRDRCTSGPGYGYSAEWAAKLAARGTQPAPRVPAPLDPEWAAALAETGRPERRAR